MLPNHELGLALGADGYFTKPVDREPSWSQGGGAGAGQRADRPVLLVIDDDRQPARAGGRRLLGGIGYSRSSTPGRGGGAGRGRGRRTPDLVVLDLLMDGMSGFEVADELRRDPRTRGVPVVVLTALEPTAQDRARLRGSVEAVVRKGDGGMVGLASVVRETLARERRRASDSGAVVRFPTEA